MKRIITLTAITSAAALSSCIVPNSQDPVGDSFKKTGDAFGRVINGVAGQPAPRTTAPQPYPQTYPQPQYSQQQ